ncbi:hypothetical protein [Micromonospora sp. WMMD980]|uniref:hypothetical protein n=1 Tax=Micromonospora sp. WMMD980 TaxID=3016088 RepID=UPI002417D9F8|nr:hypothetical protein [Micromonospora sp. WMMD980]MDG4799987.1 hypothetical protein [Micromonospora sp. WMMD980]
MPLISFGAALVVVPVVRVVQVPVVQEVDVPEMPHAHVPALGPVRVLVLGGTGRVDGARAHVVLLDVTRFLVLFICVGA